MKTVKNLYDKVYAFDNLMLAAKKAQKGKRFKTPAARFNINLEKELLRLAYELKMKTYCPGQYKTFMISEPKHRMISAAPYRDRVVHHALCNIIEPIFEKTFIYDSYANRKGKGTHRAIERCQAFCRKNKYALKCDIQKFFASIDHEVLKQQMRRKIGDARLLSLIDLIIDQSNPQEPVFEYFYNDDLFTPYERKHGLPIGNLTSQFFANIYLNKLDHFIKEDLRCRYYLRYVDDFVIFSDNKQTLHQTRENIIDFLEEFRLRIHPNKSQVFPVKNGVTFLGHRIFPTHRWLKRENVIRFKRRVRQFQIQYQKGEKTWDDIAVSLQSWNAHAAFSDSYRLRTLLYKDLGFKRNAA